MKRHTALLTNACLIALAAALGMAEAAQEPMPAPRLAPVGGTTFGFCDGLTILIDNPRGKAFTFGLDVRDLNLFEVGPREVLLKVYDPSGRALVRTIIPDDGVVTPVSRFPAGGWDQQGWYFLFQENRGAASWMRWSGLAAPDRLAAIPARVIDCPIPEGPGGTYRVIVVGTRDHVASLRIDPALPWAVAGNPFFVHPLNERLRRSYVYVPHGTVGVTLAFVQYDRPRTRVCTLRDAAGTVLCEGAATGGVWFAEARPAVSNAWDGQVFTIEVGEGPGEFMLQCSLLFPRPPPPSRASFTAVQAFLAPDKATALALKGGVILQDGQRFFLPQQVRLHEKLAAMPESEFDVRRADGTPSDIVTLAPLGASKAPAYDLTPNRNAEFRPLNGPHEPAPIADTIMFSYALHRNRQALNVALRDVAAGLRLIGPGDTTVNVTWRGMDNIAYRFGTYGWHWWRPAWRILRESDAPSDLKDLLREALVNAGDRLAFVRTAERINGNAFTTVPCALRYAAEATEDPLTRSLFDTFFQRFTTGGWGPRTGLGPTGFIYEEYGYDQHYGSYPIATCGAVADDLKDARFGRIRDGLLNVYSYTINDEVSANPFSARTAHGPAFKSMKEGPFAWKGLPGPDLTESVNGASEFFAARRKGYYMLSYHGPLTPKWQSEGFMGQVGWGGGTICQFVVPGKGTVLAGTLDAPGYGMGQHPSQWRRLHIHSLVGQTADGRPLVAADSEHFGTRLSGNTVTGEGEVRDSSVVATRSYTYEPDGVTAEVRLRPTDDDAFWGFWFKSPFHGYVTEAWEMIPFVAPAPSRPKQGAKPAPVTRVTALDEAGKDVGEVGATPMPCKTIVVDRGGYGVRIELEKVAPVMRGERDTVMIQVLAPAPAGPRDPAITPPNASSVSLRYKLVPFGA